MEIGTNSDVEQRSTKPFMINIMEGKMHAETKIITEIL